MEEEFLRATAFRLSVQGTRDADVEPTIRARSRRMTVTEANRKAMDLATKMKAEFFSLSEREQARRIGCTWKTWSRTPFYPLAKRTKAKDNGPGSPPTVSLTDTLRAVTGDGRPDEVLHNLIAEQEADREPSPLDDDAPDLPRKVRCHKRL
jgi:hypothetical protein